jgi:vacuolar-type H+-ATPase subunit E/Vma4
MALAEILAALRSEGDEEIARITAEGDAAVADLTQRAREQARKAEAAAATARDGSLSQEAAVIRHRAELHVARRLQEAREAVFQEILGLARDRLSRYRSDPAYPGTLAVLAEECSEFLGAIDVVMADPRDEELVEKILSDLGAAELLFSLECWGGIVAHDGRGVFVRNTLEDRLRRAEPDLRRQIGQLVPGLVERGGMGRSS